MISNESFLTEKVNPILEPLTIDLLIKKPEDPVDYMIYYLSRLRIDEDELPQSANEEEDNKKEVVKEEKNVSYNKNVRKVVRSMRIQVRMKMI